MVSDARPLRGEGELGALRYPVTSRWMDVFFQLFSLDANVVGPGDAGPIGLV